MIIKQRKNIFKGIVLFTIIVLWIINCKKVAIVSDIATNTNTTPIVTRLAMADGGLNMREKPELDGKIVTLIPQYAQIEMLEEVGELIEINDRKGKWAHIKFVDKSGYVFGGYLTKALLIDSQKNPDESYYFNFYSLPDYDKEEPSDCRANYMQEGCMVIIYKSNNDQIINAFHNVPDGWIDKNHLATSWSIGDAGYGGSGIKSRNIHTKVETDIWKGESQMSMDTEKPENDSESLCLKSICFDLKKNSDVIRQIKATRSLKYYEAGGYSASHAEYGTEIQIGENNSILFFPVKNVVMKK